MSRWIGLLAAGIVSTVEPRTAAAQGYVPRPTLDGRAFPDHVLALTWDDGPDAHTIELARYLHDQHVRGTFFVVRDWVPGLSEEPGRGTGVFETGYAHVPILGALVTLGHGLGNHTDHHVLLSTAPPAVAQTELGEAQRHLDPFLVSELRMFRAPGGAWSAGASAAVDADQVTASVIGPFGWNVDEKDWEASLYCRSAERDVECEPKAPGGALRVKPTVVAQRYLSAIEATGHGIVLLHDRVGHVGSRYALEIAQALIPQLTLRGYVFVAPVLEFSEVRTRWNANPATVLGPASALEETLDHERWVTDSLRQPTAGRSYREGDVNGDGFMDQCGWAVDFADQEPCTAADSEDAPDNSTRVGVECSLGGRSEPPRLWLSSSQLMETPRGFDLGDVDGDGVADICVLTSDGVACAITRRNGHQQLEEWSRPGDFGEDIRTIRLGDVNGDGRADVCGAGRLGVTCSLSDGHRFLASTTWLPVGREDGRKAFALAGTPDFELRDVNDDGRADLCIRENACGLAP